jgi:ABC-type transporter Mla maintaining outer membrane lipid asymmetry ATPase subunit MlaF
LVYSLITSNLPNKYHDNFIDQLFSKILKWSLPMKVFQSAALFDSLTVRENVGFLLYENSSLPEERIATLVTETLAAVGLKVSQVFFFSC